MISGGGPWGRCPPEPSGGRVETPLPLTGITEAEARKLNGQPVLVTFDADALAYEMHGRVITGTGDSRDGIERSVFLPGGMAVYEGQRMKVAGRLRLIRHAPAAGFPGFTEIRIEGAVKVP